MRSTRSVSITPCRHGCYRRAGDLRTELRSPVFYARANVQRWTRSDPVPRRRWRWNAHARVLRFPAPKHRSGRAPSSSCRARDERTADDDARRDENKNKQ